MNGDEIDQALFFADRAPEYKPYVEYLRDWRDVVNANSDGWAYWKIARRAANRLITLTEQLVEWLLSGGDSPHRFPQPDQPALKAFKAALTPIKSFATRHKLTAPTLREEAQKAGGGR